MSGEKGWARRLAGQVKEFFGRAWYFAVTQLLLFDCDCRTLGGFGKWIRVPAGVSSIADYR